MYQELARELGPDQPFYGLQAVGLDGSQSPYDRYEDMARHYIEEMRTVQAKGPYFLGGDCLGGSLAFEVARQLEEQGEETALLAMFDAFCPGYPRRKPYMPSLAYETVHLSRIVGFNLRNLVSLQRSGREALQRAAHAVAIRMGRMVGRQSPLLTTQAALETAYATYRPQPYGGTITLFRSKRLPVGIEAAPEMGWDGIAAGGIEIQELPTYFTTGLAGGNVLILARELRAWMDLRLEKSGMANGKAS
jgi:thioesterase domain-containing protein